MFRITLISQTESEVVLKVEGRLAEPYVPLLEQEGTHYLQQTGCLVLDLRGVQFIDDSGIALLRRWSGQSLALRGGSDFIQTLLRAHGLEVS